MKKSADKEALLDKLGVPPGTIDERERWLYGNVDDLWLSKVHEYTQAITDPDACHFCGDKKAEGYLEKARFVKQRNLRDLCTEWPDCVPVCTACGEKRAEERRLDAEKPKWGFRFIDRIFDYAETSETIPEKIWYCVVFCTIPFWFVLATFGKIGRAVVWMWKAFWDERRRQKYQQR